MTNPSARAERYLAAVRTAGATLPSDEREVLVADLREHIEQTFAERAADAPESGRDAVMAQILDELGPVGDVVAAADAGPAAAPVGDGLATGAHVRPLDDHPARLASSAREPEPPPADRAERRWDAATLATLLIGGFILPTIGWVAGVVMLWLNPRWRRADKILGTALWPVAIVVPLAAATLPPERIGRVTGLIAVVVMLAGWLPWAAVRLWRGRRMHDSQALTRKARNNG